MIRRKSEAVRLAAGAMAAAMFSCSLAGSAAAGPPQIDTDEALYVNLDHYGKPLESSVVKGCNLNGIRFFTDYGNYKAVTNMSNYAQPSIEDGRVTWELPEDVKERFYFECQLNEDQIVLPWDFDVSYKFNGVPVQPQQLVGADGLVEIDVACIPNQNAREYYRNNMLLQVATLVNMEDVNSIQAPGSQTQSLGSYKLILFAAVPGEETTFHIEIGSSDFEFMGLIMTMVPGTLEQMKELKDIKEVKDTVSSSTEEILDGMNEILDKLDAISGGMDTAQTGLRELQKARENLDAAKTQISSGGDDSLDSLEAVNDQIGKLAPDINANKQTLDQVNSDINSLVKTLRDSGDNFFELAGRLSDLEDELGTLQGILNTTDKAGVEEHIQAIEEHMAQLERLLAVLENGVFAVDLDQMDEGKAGARAAAWVKAADNFRDSSEGLVNGLDPLLGREKAQDLKNQLSGVNVSGVSGNYQMLLLMAAGQLRPILANTRELLDMLRAVIHRTDLSGGVENAMDMAKQLGEVMGTAQRLISDITSVNQTVNGGKENFDAMLDDLSAATERVHTGTQSLIQTFRTIQETEKENRNSVENGTRQTLDGLIDILEKASSSSTATEKLQKGNTELKDSVKKEIDKVGGETNLLELDAGREMISFTSDENLPPSSIQVVLRTEEISEEDLNTNAVDIEPAVKSAGMLDRILDVFRKIWSVLTGWLR